jgi:hypothetical protein
VEQTSGTTSGAPPQAPDDSQPRGSEAPVAAEAQGASETRPPLGGTPGFGARGRARRRARFLRKARELAYRDLGGLVFNLHRFGQRNDELVLSKLNTLGQIDSELRTLEAALGERETVTVLREAGITACPRCAAIHSGDDHFCPNCGLSMSRHVDLPIAGSAPPAAAPASTREPAAGTQPSPQPAAAATPPVPARAASTPPRTAKRDGPRTPASSGGRSPAPPAQRTASPEAASPSAASEDGEQTQVLRPLEPEK